MSRRVTHVVEVKFYASFPESIPDAELRCYVRGYLEGKLPKLDLEQISVRKIGKEAKKNFYI